MGYKNRNVQVSTSTSPQVSSDSGTAPAHRGGAAMARRPGRRRRPSAGFVAVCVTYLLVLAFLIWGLVTPDLDRVWTLHHELKIGKLGAPDKSDRKLLGRALRGHAELAHALLPAGEIGLISAHSDGWLATPAATIIRTPKATERVIVLDVETPRDLLPFKVDVHGHEWRKQIQVTQHQTYEIALPAPPGAPELIVVQLEGRGLRDDPSVLGVRITFAREPRR